MSHGRNLVVYHLPPRESETLESAQESGEGVCLVLVHLQKGMGSHSLRGEVCLIELRSHSKRNKDEHVGSCTLVHIIRMFEPHKNAFLQIPV